MICNSRFYGQYDRRGCNFESFVLEDTFDGCVSSRVDEFDLEDDSEGTVSDDFDTLVVDVCFLFCFSIIDMFGDDSLRIQIGYASY